MTLNDLLTDGQTHTGSLKRVGAVKAFKGRKDLLMIVRLNANTVIPDPKHALFSLLLNGEMNNGSVTTVKL